MELVLDMLTYSAIALVVCIYMRLYEEYFVL
jgi:hypothetical protein